MEYPYPSLPDVPRISLLDERAISLGPNSIEENNWHDSARYALVQGLRMLRHDHESGAKELAKKALGLLLDVAKIAGSGLSTEGSTSKLKKEQERGYRYLVEKWKYTVRKCGWIIARYGRPSMGSAITAAIVKALQNTVNTTAGSKSEGQNICSNPDPLDGSIQECIQALKDQLRLRKSNSGTEVGVHLRKFIRERFGKSPVHGSGDLEVKILTLSSSSTVKRALNTVFDLELKEERNQPQERQRLRLVLRIMESRPLCEGVTMAEALVNMAEKSGYTHMLQIQIASDASVAMLARDVDIVLLGADRISESGDVSNKVGSFPAVLCAKIMSNNHALVLTVSELEKVAKPGKTAERGEEDNDVAELTDAWDSNKRMETRPGSWEEMVRVRNVYFEWVPAQYIHCYVCEDGPLTVEDVKKRSKLAFEAEKEMFSEFD